MADAPLPKLRSILSQFQLPGAFVTATPYGSGHINDTFAATFASGDGASTRYILQRINRRVFRNVPALMENVSAVCQHMQSLLADAPDRSRRALTLIPTKDGHSFHCDTEGDYWRVYIFIERASSWDVIRSPADAFQAGRAFGQFQLRLATLRGPRLNDTIPRFHDTRQRFENLRTAIGRADASRRAEAAGDIEFALQREAIVDTLLDLQHRGEIPERVTHNDTKLNNVLLDDATGEAICVIDLDTVMPGLSLYDFGDLVRSATNSAPEDEVDLHRVVMQLPVFEALAAGFIAGTDGVLNSAERAHLAFAGQLITFEIGLRFLTDFLEGDVYFKVKRPRHNLERARCQFALLQSMEQQRAAMEAAVSRA